MKNFCKALIISLALTAPVLAQNVQATSVNYGNGNIVKETSGNGAPTDACTDLLRYTQKDATAGQNIWQCVSGHMVQQGSPATSSPATASSFGTVKLFTGQSNTTLAKVATTGAYSDLSGLPTIASYSDFIGSGASHAHGLVPDPGASAGTTRYLREDGTWAAVPSGAGAVPGSTPDLYSWDGSQWVRATAAQIQAKLSEDTANNSQVGFHQGTDGDSSCHIPAAGEDYLCFREGQIEMTHNGGAYFALGHQVQLQTNGTDNTVQTKLNLKSGSGIDLVKDDSGALTIAATNGGVSMIVPRDVNTHMVIVDSKAEFQTDSFYLAVTGASALSTVPDAGGFIYESIPTGATANTDSGIYDVNKSVLAGKSPSFKTVFGLSTAENVNAWIGLCSFCSITNADHLDLGTSNVAFVGFRHFSGTEATNWTCYASNWNGAGGSTMDSGVAVDTNQMQVFDVIYISGVPHWYIGGVEKCSGLGATAMIANNIPDVSAAIGAVDVWKNTTTASVTGKMFEIYYGAS